MTALAILVVALCAATAAGTWFAIRARLDRQWTAVLENQQVYRDMITGMQQRLDGFAAPAPVIAPDPRVDELMRVVSTLKGAEALQKVLQR